MYFASILLSETDRMKI